MHSASLFPGLDQPRPPRRVDLDQWMTPRWAAQQLVEDFFPDLGPHDMVLEPTCGDGAFLEAVPAHVRAVGIEIDPRLARLAEENTGRRVVVGDFREISLPDTPTAIVGNPPFKMRLLDELLVRAHAWLPENGRCGLVLGSYMIQTPNTVLRWNEQWSLDQRLLPRTLFPRSIRPLVFLMFTKDRRTRMLGGFALYREASEIGAIESQPKLLLVRGRPGQPRASCWRAVVEWGLREMGGQARLRDLYDLIEPRRPSENRWWQEKVRQTLQRHYQPLGGGVWALPTLTAERMDA